MPNPNSFWVVSFRPDSDESFVELNERLNSLNDKKSSGLSSTGTANGGSSSSSSSSGSFPITQIFSPDFKVAPLATLISLSEVLAKNEAFFNQTLQKIVETLKSLLSSKPSAFVIQNQSQNNNNNNNTSLTELEDNLLMDDGRSYENYIFKGWEWNRVKYNRVENRKLEEVVDVLLKDVTSIDNSHKLKLSSYNQAKAQATALRRKRNGNLSVKSLYDVVSQDHFVDPSSEFLETLLIAVPNNLLKDWNNSYEHLTSLVVPRSSTKIAQDEEFSLLNVTIFKKVKEEFVKKCREKKFIVREFSFDQDEIEKVKIEQREFELHEKELWSELLRLSRINFSDTFQAIVHLKVIQTYIESLLRYGLPANYCIAILRPDQKNQKKVLNHLNSFNDSLEVNNNDAKDSPSKGKKKNRGSSKFGNGGSSNGNSNGNLDGEVVGGEYANVLEKEVFEFVLFELIDPRRDGKDL